MKIDELNLEIIIAKIVNNLISISFQSESKLKLLIKDIKAIDTDDKIIECDCSLHGVIDVVLNKSQTNKTIDFNSNIGDCKIISFVIVDRATRIKYPVRLQINQEF